jgi:dTDP-4-dehydrorhamnose 3,5-epimerase
MIEGVIIKKLQKYDDERGWLAETWRSDETEYRPVMSYASITRPRVVRGPHEHREQSDYFIFFGPGTFELYLWDRRESSRTYKEYFKEKFGEDNPAIVIVPPGVVHGYKNISDMDALSINLADKLYRGKGKKEEVDEIRWEKDPNSPYKIL